jgi:hypothetical protein
MHCGTAIPEIEAVEAAPPGGEPSDAPPESIGAALWDYNLPSKSKDWYSGFEVWFMLVDSSGRPTRSDGELTIRFRLERAFIGHKFEINVPVRGEDFAEVAEGGKWPAGSFGYLHQFPKAVLQRASGSSGRYELDVLFKTPDGRELVGQGSFVEE